VLVLVTRGVPERLGFGKANSSQSASGRPLTKVSFSESRHYAIGGDQMCGSVAAISDAQFPLLNASQPATTGQQQR
jgi:hypothetical protein